MGKQHDLYHVYTIYQNFRSREKQKVKGVEVTRNVKKVKQKLCIKRHTRLQKLLPHETTKNSRAFE